MTYSGENLCVAAGCEASCCHGSSFDFSLDQYQHWIALAGVSVIEESVGNLRMIRAVFSRRNGSGHVIHAVMNVEGRGERHLVKVDGRCPLLQSNNSCVAWGSVDACVGLRRGDKRCTAFRKRDGLKPVERGFNE